MPKSSANLHFNRAAIWAAFFAFATTFFATVNQRSIAAEKTSLDELVAARQQLYSAYSAQLHDLAAWCDTQGLKTQAEFTRAWLPDRDPAMIYIFALADDNSPPANLLKSSSDAAGNLPQQWWHRFTELRNPQADKLFDLAQTALSAHQPALAYELARETVRENPDHEAARKVLGDRKRDNRWISRETLRRISAGQVWSDVAGWIPVDQAPMYDHGQRFYRGQWLSPEEDARLHSNIYNGWHVESDHYLVVTNQSLEAGVELAKKLEKLSDVWRQVFLTYYAKPSEIEGWFNADPASSTAPGTTGAAQKLHQVVYFHDKQEYIDTLKAAQPQIDKSIGFYSIANKSAYFFAGDEQYDGTIYHEATHQLFQESHAAVSDPGHKNNFWIYEGIACYMESLAEHRLVDDETYGMYFTVGGENAGRVPAARKRLLDDIFYVPFRELVAIGRQDFQHDTRIAPLYSQIAGQTYFLMHYDSARYRPALMEYLVALYGNRTNPETLEKQTGAKYEELDQQYRDFLK
jgi:hypothetical protein